MLVSITRLRLRSNWYLLPFAWRAMQSSRQALASPGCLGVRTRKTKGLAFWTLTLWESEASLKSFLVQGPHRRVMPKLARWCDEAAVAHWETGTGEAPDWMMAAGKLRDSGRLSRVAHPSAAQASGRIEVS